MKLTELWTPDECREAMELIGGVVLPSVHGEAKVEYFPYDGDKHFWTAFEGLSHPSRYLTDAEVACIIQVAAEQVVREGGLWITLGAVTGRFWIQDDVGMAVDSYPTYLAALLAALRAIKEQS